MFPYRDEQWNNNNTRVSALPAAVFLYLGAEVFIAGLIAVLLAILALIQSLLPRPPRDLKNDIVVVTGAGSGLGKAVAEEFHKAGCTVACIDQNLNSQSDNTASRTNFASRYQRIEEFQPDNDFCQMGSSQQKIFTYKCNSANKTEILEAAKQIQRDIGHVDVLVTCAGDSSQNILDSVSTNLMSHYWTMLAFIPSMIQCKHSHIVTVISATSTGDAYIGSKAAVAGLIEAIGQHFSNASHLTFTTVAPKVEPRLIKQSEEQTARDIVQAVRRDQRSLTTSWVYSVFYPMCCTIYETITSFTEWLYRPGCEDLT